MSQPTEKQEQKAASSGLMVRAANAAVIMAFSLILIKAWAYHMSGAVSMLGSLLDSVMDILASLINLVAIRFAIVPADNDHRFGHGKAEAIAGLVQAMVIFLSALFLFVEAVRKMLSPEPLRETGIGISVILVSVLLTMMLVLYQRHVIRKTGSVAISADHLHYSGDILMNFGVLIAFVLSGYFELYYADPIIGILVAGYLAYNVKQIAHSSVDMLMDRELDDEERAPILALIRAHEEVHGVHDIRTRKSGLDLFIQFHLEMDGSISLGEAHRISEEVEQEIIALYPEAEVLIHADPEDQVGAVSFRE
ncbi:cation diffusion facilitator family transporter [Paremcibacter congregatus]|uniref:cation diffusion facilitator family transporter n=1 Tax=Paremcibacter congregatus TaxID=2043170 RepID=UPI0030EF8A40|tara:strand:+ start:4294 stop:5217 length:924 start_codon:yes stop_codon:yes gene_type:complete